MLESFRQDNTTVSFIGSGNLAWHLAPALDNTDFAVREVFSRNPKHAQALVEKLYQADVKLSLDFSDSSSRIFVLAIADDSIASVVQELVLPDHAILVHTSGSQPLSVLEYAATPFTGVYYPLQTFTKSRKPNFNEIPVFIESDDNATQKLLVSMAGCFNEEMGTFREFNLMKDAAASKFAFDNWPSPIVFSGFEIGQKIHTGLPITKSKISNSPVKDVFAHCIPLDKNDANGRMSWDETAVLVAARGYEKYFGAVTGKIIVNKDGSNTWYKTGTRDKFLTLKMPVNQLEHIIDSLMMHPPSK